MGDLSKIRQNFKLRTVILAQRRDESRPPPPKGGFQKQIFMIQTKDPASIQWELDSSFET